jgi:hypothetical protein
VCPPRPTHATEVHHSLQATSWGHTAKDFGDSSDSCERNSGNRGKSMLSSTLKHLTKIRICTQHVRCVHTRDERLQMRSSADGQTLQTYTLARNTPTNQLLPNPPPTHTHDQDTAGQTFQTVCLSCCVGHRGLAGTVAKFASMGSLLPCAESNMAYIHACVHICVCVGERVRTHTRASKTARQYIHTRMHRYMHITFLCALSHKRAHTHTQTHTHYG